MSVTRSSDFNRKLGMGKLVKNSSEPFEFWRTDLSLQSSILAINMGKSQKSGIIKYNVFVYGSLREISYDFPP